MLLSGSSEWLRPPNSGHALSPPSIPDPWLAVHISTWLRLTPRNHSHPRPRHNWLGPTGLSELGTDQTTRHCQEHQPKAHFIHFWKDSPSEAEALAYLCWHLPSSTVSQLQRAGPQTQTGNRVSLLFNRAHQKWRQGSVFPVAIPVGWPESAVPVACRRAACVDRGGWCDMCVGRWRRAVRCMAYAPVCRY